MYVKTVQMDKNAIENFNTLRSKLSKKSAQGYCEKDVNHMLAVSNQRICKTKQRNNVGFYYRTVFPVRHAKAVYTFRTPADFGYGGISLLDGKIMKQETKDIW
jgi:hypothetical protein